MNLAGKSFKNLQNNRVVTVKDSFENITILEDGQKMDTRALLNTSMYVEHIDPKSFFNNSSVFNTFAEKIKSIPLDNIKESYPSEDGLPSANDSAIIGYEDPEMEKLEMMKKYKDLGFDSSAIQKQANLLSKIIDPEESANIPVIKPFVPQVINEGEIPAERVNAPEPTRTQQHHTVDPIVQMFRNVKRTVDLNLNIEIKNKIPRADFIEMMEDSYETSIIDFLAEEFTRQILNNPEGIKEKVVNEIKRIVYKENPVEVEQVKKVAETSRKKATKKVEEVK